MRVQHPLPVLLSEGPTYGLQVYITLQRLERALALDRNADAHDRSPRAGRERDLSVVLLLDDSTRYIEPEARAFPDVLGGEERLEGVGLYLEGHADTVVDHLDDHWGQQDARRPDRDRTS